MLPCSLRLAVSTLADVHYVGREQHQPHAALHELGHGCTNIQDAVDVARVTMRIVVTNGIYATGERAVYGTMTNRGCSGTGRSRYAASTARSSP